MNPSAMSIPAESFQSGLTVNADFQPRYQTILPPELTALLARLQRRYRRRVVRLLEQRRERQQRFDAGELPDFPGATQEIRESEWKVAPIPDELLDRRVEITGSVERKMIINALNSGARVFMADFEDATAPTWKNLMEGQINLRDAVRREIEFTNDNGKTYRLRERPAVLMVRPRGWHLEEKHVDVDGLYMVGALFDATVYLYHNAHELLRRGSGPYLYLPKLENRFEAALWQDVLTELESELELPEGTIKVTVLIETITAAFEMDEILWTLRNRITGLNCGRWDYIFSYIKRFKKHSDKILPDRAQVTMSVPFLRAYSQLLIRTCHRRGAFAIGGMAAQIPVRDDPEASRAAVEKVRADKEREAGDGHDGTWVAHPGLIPTAMGIFDRLMPEPNQRHRLCEEVTVTADDLLRPSQGTITENGVRGNITVAIRYLAAWLSGQGCVPIDHLMEDAATAEIARAQLWQWIHHDAGRLEDGRDIDLPLIRRWQDEQLGAIHREVGDAAFDRGRFAAAAELLSTITADDEFVEFITLPAYERI